MIGVWGGQHIGVTFGTTDSAIDYDCAEGAIYGPVSPDEKGHFVASGTHTPGQGGPDRAGYEPPTYSANYSGSISGETMTLVVDVPGLKLRLGPFTLRHDAQGNLSRCL